MPYAFAGQLGNLQGEIRYEGRARSNPFSKSIKVALVILRKNAKTALDLGNLKPNFSGLSTSRGSSSVG